MTERVIKVLFSLPVILIALYIIPFLGICLIIAKYIVEKAWNEKDRFTKSMLSITAIGILLNIPRAINYCLTKINFKNIVFPVLKTIIESDIYKELITYGNRLIIVGIILLIIGFIINKTIVNVKNRVISLAHSQILEETKRQDEIYKENNLKIQEQQERAKNFHVVTCPHCGAVNQLTAKTGKCSHCRNIIE